MTKPKDKENELKNDLDTEASLPKFIDSWWKKGSWDLNMLVKDGKMDWDGVIVAGRAAVVGFFVAYIVDALTGLDAVGQTGNYICKAGVFVTVAETILFRKNEDFKNLKNLADEATLYDKQWQTAWKNQNESSPGKEV